MCQLVAYNRLKTVKKIGSPQKVVAVAYKRFQLQAFAWERFGVLRRWSLTRGGHTWRLETFVEKFDDY